MAMLADMGGTFVLVSNALRLVSFQRKNKKAPKCPQIHYTSTVETLPMVSGTGKECKSGCTNYLFGSNSLAQGLTFFVNYYR